MTVDELRKEAKALGYNIIKIKKREKLLPCTCGCKRREHWDSLRDGEWLVVLKCERCRKEACGKNETEAVHNWNEMIKAEKGEK